MITVKQFKPEGSDYRLTFDFTIGEKTIEDDQLWPSQESATRYMMESKKDVLLINFERFTFANQARIKKDDEVKNKALSRCLDANKYFNEHKDLTLHKIADMTIKMQEHLIKLLPETKSPSYDTQFKIFNNLIGFCKATIKDSKNSLSIEPGVSV